jgi:hypothetical protein
MRNIQYSAGLTSLLLLVAMLAAAADPTGTIAGTVADPSGAAVAGAKVTAINPATGLSRETTTSADGGYVFPLIPAGTYNVVVEISGFRRFEQRGVDVKVNSNSTVDVTLQLGATSESVTVDANAEMVDTRSGTLAQVVSEQKIVELPLNGRNVATLVLLAPGTADLNASNARGSGDAMQTATYPGAQSITSNGARSDGVNYNLDGGSTIDHYTNVNNPLPNPDALQEFSVQTNNYSAEHGRASGAVVNAVTKSGTNEFHGSAFEFLRNGALNSRNFFAPTTDKLKRNQFGGSLGGPIKHNQLFFFGTYQGTQIRNISTGNSAFVLTPAQSRGDFSSVSRQLIDPITKQPFEGNRIPVSRFSPVVSKLLPLIPVSNAPDGLINFDRPINDHEHQVMGRMDYIHGDHRLYGRYFDSRYTRAAVSGAENLVASARGAEWFNRNASVSHTYTIRPNVLNNFIFSYNKTSGSIISGAPFSLSSIGVPIAGPNPPEINMTISGYFTLNTGAPGDFDRHNFHFADSLHWIRGAHELAFGGDFLRMNVDLANSYRQAGRFRFRGTRYSGDPRSDFLVGFVDQFIQGGGEYAARRGNLGSLFFQDNWRVSRQLTLNLGVRWDPFLPYTDELGRTECFRPGLQSQRFPNAPRGYLYAGDTGCPAGGSESVWTQVSPRIGFAYNPGGHGNTTVRGGFGVFYQPPFVEAYNNMVDSAPFSPQVIRNGVPLDNPYTDLRNPFPAQFAPTLPSSDVRFDTPMVGVSYTADWKPARMLGWNLTIEHQLHNNILIRAGYVGSKGTHLGFNTDVNVPRYFPGAADIDPQLRRPYSDFDLVTMNTSGANSNYNSLQLGVEKRFSKGFTAGANYTWAKSLDWTSYLTDLDGINVINPFNARAYRGVSDFNVPHRLVANYVWQLPSPSAGALRLLLGGWETSGILNWQSGFPLNISSGEDNSLTAIGNDNADVVSKPGYTSGSKADRINKWFTTEAFRTNREGTFGTSGRNTLIGPNTFNLSVAAHKSFQIGERVRLQYRAEFFNAPNHTNLNNPGTTVTTSSFGRITSAGDPRIIQMALRLHF